MLIVFRLMKRIESPLRSCLLAFARYVGLGNQWLFKCMLESLGYLGDYCACPGSTIPHYQSAIRLASYSSHDPSTDATVDCIFVGMVTFGDLFRDHSFSTGSYFMLVLC